MTSNAESVAKEGAAISAKFMRNVRKVGSEEVNKIFDDRLRPVPEVQSLDHATATKEDIIDALRLAGGVILRNCVSEKDLEAVWKEIYPHLGDYRQKNGEQQHEEFDVRTKRVLGLAGKSKNYIEKITQHPTFKAVRDEMLTSSFYMWGGNEMVEVRNPPTYTMPLSSGFDLELPLKPLHRDDIVSLNVCNRKSAEQYVMGQDTAMGFFVAAKPSTKENGATRFIPGSHLWDNRTPPDESLCVQAELNTGDAFMFLASCYHGASANNSEDSERVLYGNFFVQSHLRQEENQYIANSWEDIAAKNYSEETLRDIGYAMAQPYCGWVDFQEPFEVLRQRDEQKKQSQLAVAASA